MITFTHTLSSQEALTLIYSLGEWLDRLQGLGDWQTGDENVEIPDETKQEIRIIAALRETFIAHRFLGS